MAIDRAAALRNAEKLLRQGKPDLAIAEYLRVVEEFPRDWNTGNVLGDLYLRAGQVDRAVDRFIRIADSLSDEGFLPKAHAIYRKVLKIKPDHEHALLQGAEIACSQGLLVDARAYLNTLLDLRRNRGDRRGVAQMRIRLAMIDPADYAARFTAARARIDVNDAAGALRDFKDLAAELTEKGRQIEAIDALREAALLSPDDQDIREQLLQAHLANGDFGQARECASTSVQFKAIAAELEASGQADDALASLREAARLEPSDIELQKLLARVFAARGDLATAADYLTAETAANDPQLLLMLAEIRLRGERVDEGLEIARRLLADDPMRRQDVAMLGWTVAERAPEAGFRVVELAADASVAAQDWPSAAAGIQEFVTRVPNHIPALLRLVEICVDGGLEATMYSAQAQLADAYITAGSASEARFIAEDLVAREPWDRANIERFRRALVLMGDADPDAVIAERLSGQSPFLSTDLSLRGEELPPFETTLEASATRLTAVPEPASSRTASIDAPAAPATLSNLDDLLRALRPVEPPSVAVAPLRAPGPNALDVHRIVELENAPTANDGSASVKVSGTGFTDMKSPAISVPAPASAGAAGRLDDVSAKPRGDSAKRSSLGGSDEEFRRGVALVEAGQVDEAIPILQLASKAPRLRFAASSILGRVFRKREMMAQALAWLERAAEAPAPTPDEGYQLLYELAQALEDSGESARALAICIELQAEAGDYRDVVARVERLAGAQARG